MKLNKNIASILIIIFIAFCLLHLFSKRPLWLDEGFVLENIQTSSYSELFAPLKKEQAFPRIHLCIVKYISEHWDYSLISLRSLSVVFMILAVFVWSRLYRIGFSDDRYFLMGILSMTSSYWFLYYAAEFKPYSMDVLAVALVAVYLINQRKYEGLPPKWGDYVVTLLIPTLLFFSYATIFVFWIVGFNFLVIIRNNKQIVPLAVSYILWSGALFGGFYLTDLQHSAFRPNLINYWESYFISTASVGDFFETFWEGVRRISVFWFGNSKFFIRFASFVIPLFVFSLFGFGISALLKDRAKIYRIESLALILFAELFVFGILQKYPFTGARITLFIAPFVFFMILKGIQKLEKVKWLHYMFGLGYCILIALAFGNTVIHLFKFYKMTP